MLAPSFEATDWPRILGAYDDLLDLEHSPVAALNRSVALAKVEGPDAGLQTLDELEKAPELRRYYPLFATRGELLRRLGRREESVACYRRALALTPSAPVRRFLQRRIDEHSALRSTAS